MKNRSEKRREVARRQLAEIEAGKGERFYRPDSAMARMTKI